jgi:anaerobic magnesium-protoporphyrin IX monomethyl ester cyclase
VRVLFIFVNLNAEEGFNHGIAALSGCLKARGHITGLLNLNDSLYRIPSDEELVRIVAEWKPGFIAFSVMTQQYRQALHLARKLKSSLPHIPIGVGGVHAIMCTEEIKEDRFWDYIGVGECDIAFPELVDQLQQGPAGQDVPNFCVRLEDGTYQQNPLGPYPDLDSLPKKDYEIFDLPHMLSRKNGWQSILTSRGCPYRCTYCFNHEVVDRYRREGGYAGKSYLRHYSINRIIGELKEIKRRHPYVKTFIFDDDLFTLNKQYCCDFVKAYTDSGIKTPFVLNAHVQTFSRPVAKALAEAPCMIVKFGLESGSYELRKTVLQRYMSNEAIVEAFGLCHEYGLHSSAFLMFGLPYETRDMMEETIDLIARIRPGRFRWAIFFPFPGTKSYSICREGNLIDEKKMETMTNFFSGSCLKFDSQTDLFIRKLQRTFHWWVNSRARLELSSQYEKLVNMVDRMDLSTWLETSESVLSFDRQLSKRHLDSSESLSSSSRERFRHYSVRYTEVMAVDSDFLLAEKGEYKDQAVRQWKAFREQNDSSFSQKRSQEEVQEPHLRRPDLRVSQEDEMVDEWRSIPKDWCDALGNRRESNQAGRRLRIVSGV